MKTYDFSHLFIIFVESLLIFDFMNPEQRIAAYQKLLDEIKATLNRVDGQITTLVGEYENLKGLYEVISGDIVALAMNSSSARS